MVISVTLVRHDPGPGSLQVLIFQDSPEFKNTGDSANNLGIHEALELLESFGSRPEEAQAILEKVLNPPARYRQQFRLSEKGERFLRENYPGVL